MNVMSEKAILKEFIHDNAELEILEKIANEFNIFNALNIVNNEIKHSNFLSWLMSPNESHGLGDYFLASFLKMVSSKASSLGITGPSVFDIISWNFDDAEIFREWNHIDIIIKCENHKLICAIENKIYSSEHNEQLQRYKEIIRRYFKNYKKYLVYLTIDEETPSDNKYIPLGYSDILVLIEHLIKNKKDKLSSEIFSFISNYRDIVRRNIMDDPEIQKICQQIYRRHKKALDLIFKYTQSKSLKIRDYLVDIIQKDPNLILDDSSKASIRFIPKSFDDIIPQKGGGWTKTKRILLFEIQNKPDCVKLILVIGPGSTDIREKIFNIAKANSKIFNKRHNKLTKKWCTIYSFSNNLLTTKEYDKEDEEIRDLLEKKFKEFTELHLPKIEKEIEKFNEHVV